MPFLLFVVVFLFNCGDKFFGKKLQTTIEFDLPRIIAANLVNCALSFLFYWASSGFEIYFEPKMELFSALYGIACFAGIALNIVLYKHASIPLASIILTSASITGSSLFGYAILREQITAARLAAAALVIFAVALPALEGVRGKNKMSKKDLTFCAFYFVFAVALNIFNTLYVAFPDMNGRQYCLHVNIYQVVICAFAAVYMLKKGTHKISDVPKSLTPAQAGIIGLRCGITSVIGLCTIALVGMIPVTMFNIINCSLVMISAVAVALICYREKLTLSQIVSLCMLIAATGLSTM